VAVSNALAAAATALRQLADVLDALAAEPVTPPPVGPAVEPTWGSGLLWTCPPETRLSVRELCAAVNRPRSWAYRAVRRNGTSPPLPHRKLDGLLVFVAGEVRQWVREHEHVVVPVRSGPLVVGRGRP
jgi:predicted DNA-binding transcriptional regulator AlpA